jgi:hypothetical protein
VQTWWPEYLRSGRVSKGSVRRYLSKEQPSPVGLRI